MYVSQHPTIGGLVLSETFVELKNIGKSFDVVKVIEHIDFKIETGKIYALAGENGAGKSTLCNIISGSLEPSEGTIWYEGKDYDTFSITQAKEIGIKMVHQELQVLPLMTIAENVFIGEEVTSKGFVDKTAMNKRTKELLDMVGLKADPDTKVENIEIAGRQLVEIARALNHNAKLIILDEPTSSLTLNEISTFFEVVKKLRDQGVSFIFISHRMDEVFELSDEVLVLKDGCKVAQMKTSDTNQNELISLMVGRSYEDYYKRKRTHFGKVALNVEHLSSKRQGIYHDAYMPKDISFSLEAGEVLGLSGLVGSGRTELARLLFGELQKGSGDIFINGEHVQIKNSKDAIKNGMAWITENRKEEGLLLEASINENTALTTLHRNLSGIFINDKKQTEITDKYIDMLGIKATDRDQIVKRLSGGNQQKVVVGKWLATTPKILVMDEPTRGIDVGAKVQIYQLINELTSQGMAILLISSELPEIMGMSDRIIVMYEGKLTGELSRDEFSETKIMEHAVGKE